MRRNVFLLLLGFLLIFSLTVHADVPTEANMIPWTYESIAETAAANGELHFFFMATEGYRVNYADDGIPEKWGDGCLVVFPNGQLMLIDAGMPHYAPLLIENLHRLGVEKLDYLVISHQHDDHAGAVYTDNGLLDAIEVGQAFYNGTYNTNWSNIKLLENVLDAHHVERQAVSEGFTLDIGGVQMRVLSPSPEIVGETLPSTPAVNNASVVMRLDYQDFSALFTGDIYKEKELELVRTQGELLDVDLLKIPHHGRDTSNSKKFAEAVTPVLAVATGHVGVSPAQYYVYTKHGARVLLDYVDGYIHVVSDGTSFTWEQSHERTTDYYDKFEFEAMK